MEFWKKLALAVLCLALLTGCGGEAPGANAEDTRPPVEKTEPPIEETKLPEDEGNLPGYGEDDAPIYTDTGSDDQTTAGETLLDEDGTYSTAEDVALYLHTYGELPDNFITKNEARDLGWPGGGLEEYAPGKCIGGDTFGNREGLLPEGRYHECDINTLGEDSRGAERLVWDDEGNIYYTADHYESFELLYAGVD